MILFINPDQLVGIGFSRPVDIFLGKCDVCQIICQIFCDEQVCLSKFCDANNYEACFPLIISNRITLLPLLNFGKLQFLNRNTSPIPLNRAGKKILDLRSHNFALGQNCGPSAKNLLCLPSSGV